MCCRDAKNEQKTFDRPDPSSDDWDNTVAICAMMTDAQPDDVLEWLQYHKYDTYFLILPLC